MNNLTLKLNLKHQHNKQIKYRLLLLIFIFLSCDFYCESTENKNELNNNNKQSTNESKSNIKIKTEIAYWNTIKNSNDPKEFESYLKKYPNGLFADLAWNKLNQIFNNKSSHKTTNLNIANSIIKNGVLKIQFIFKGHKEWGWWEAIPEQKRDMYQMGILFALDEDNLETAINTIENSSSPNFLLISGAEEDNKVIGSTFNVVWSKGLKYKPVNREFEIQVAEGNHTIKAYRITKYKYENNGRWMLAKGLTEKSSDTAEKKIKIIAGSTTSIECILSADFEPKRGPLGGLKGVDVINTITIN